MDEKLIKMMEEFADDRVAQVAANMIEDGMSMTLVAKYTELPDKTLMALKEEIAPDKYSKQDIAMMQAEAEKQGQHIVIYNMVANGEISLERGAAYLGIQPERLQKRMTMSGFDVPQQRQGFSGMGSMGVYSGPQGMGSPQGRGPRF